MLNVAKLFTKADNFLENVVNFGNGLVQSVVTIEAAFGPGSASKNLDVVAAGIEAFTGEVGLAKKLLDAQQANFSALVAFGTQIANGLKALTSNPTAAPTPTKP